MRAPWLTKGLFCPSISSSDRTMREGSNKTFVHQGGMRAEKWQISPPPQFFSETKIVTPINETPMESSSKMQVNWGVSKFPSPPGGGWWAKMCQKCTIFRVPTEDLPRSSNKTYTLSVVLLSTKEHLFMHFPNLFTAYL